MFPEGIDSIADIPNDLFRAIVHAYRVIDWYADLTEKEMPPEWMWAHEDALETHLNRVIEDRKSKYGLSSSGDSDETPGMVQNELAKGRGRDS